MIINEDDDSQKRRGQCRGALLQVSHLGETESNSMLAIQTAKIFWKTCDVHFADIFLFVSIFKSIDICHASLLHELFYNIFIWCSVDIVEWRWNCFCILSECQFFSNDGDVVGLRIYFSQSGCSRIHCGSDVRGR